jgi:hypothetical protein
MTKNQLAEKIKRRFGYPMIKVELDPQHITDAIDYARQKWMKWAVGQATAEVFFTLRLSAGQTLYDLPMGVTEIISKDTTGVSSGINTLFTIDNFLYNQGLYESLWNTANQGYTIVSYHIARDFLDTVRKYTPDVYNYKYHPFTNQLEIHPPPVSGSAQFGSYYGPGWILLRAYMVEGSTVRGGWEGDFKSGDSDEDFYGLDWIYDYATAECKMILGEIRRKFANFASIGNTGLSLDGDQLVSEGKEEKERLEEKLQLEEVYDGLGISIGY